MPEHLLLKITVCRLISIYLVSVSVEYWSLYILDYALYILVPYNTDTHKMNGCTYRHLETVCIPWYTTKPAIHLQRCMSHSQWVFHSWVGLCHFFHLLTLSPSPPFVWFLPLSFGISELAFQFLIQYFWSIPCHYLTALIYRGSSSRRLHCLIAHLYLMMWLSGSRSSERASLPSFLYACKWLGCREEQNLMCNDEEVMMVVIVMIIIIITNIYWIFTNYHPLLEAFYINTFITQNWSKLIIIPIS